MQLTKIIVSVSLAINVVSAFNLFTSPKSSIAIIHGVTDAEQDYADSYLAPFATEGQEEPSYELIDDHEDLVQDRHGAIVSLRKRGDDCQKYHKVVRGDDCYKLSLKYNVEMSNLFEWNEHINSKCTNLYPGKSYCVRKDGEVTLEKSCTGTHLVQSTDTCITVAKKYNLKLDQFYDMNPSINRKSCDNLLTGGTYCVKEETKQVLKDKLAHKVAKKKTSAISTKLSRSTRRYKAKSTKKRTTKKSSSLKKKKTTTKMIVNKHAVVKTTKKSTKKSTTKKTTTKKTTIKKTTTKKTTTKKTTTKKTTTTTTTTTTKRTTTKPTTTTTTTTTKSTTTKKPSTTTTEEKAVASSSSDKRKLLQKGSALTYYWIAHPEDSDHGGKDVTVKTCDGKPLGTVPSQYADALVMEGTGVLGNKIVNLGGCSCNDYKCFMEVDKKEDPYGLTSFGGPLRPFITIAANDIARNTKIFVPAFVGWEIPGSSKKHNGCLLVDDRSWSFDKNHIDMYVYRERNYRTLNKEHKVSKVDIYEGGDCHLISYL